MKPSVKFGLIGGIVFSLILISGTYLLESSVRNMTVAVYLKEMVLIVSVIAGIKGIRDLQKNVPLELRDGLRSGLTTVVIISGFIFTFNMTYPFTVSEADSNATNELFYAEYFKRVPVTDTTAAAFEKEKKSYEAALKSGDIGMASISLRRAKMIRPSAAELDPKMAEVDHMMYQKSKEIGFLVKNILTTSVFPQLVMGFLTAFLTTMFFRSRQQAGM